MPYAFVDQDGIILQVFAKPSPFMRLGAGERMVNYFPPSIDEEVETAAPKLPITGLDVEFEVTPKAADVVAKVWTRRKSYVVQSKLDSVAQSKGYDNILSACSYAGSPVFGDEGTAFKNWRDACWAKLFEMLATGVPSDEALLAALPAFTS